VGGGMGGWGREEGKWEGRVWGRKMWEGKF